MFLREHQPRLFDRKFLFGNKKVTNIFQDL